MLVVMKHKASEAEVRAVVKEVENMGYEARPMPGKQRTTVGLVGNDGGVDAARIQGLSGVLEIILVTKPYKQVSREWRDSNTVVGLPNGVQFGGREINIIAGPCAVEGESEILEIAHRLKEDGATVLRGGAFKPRTSPYSFQGLEENGLKLLAAAKEVSGLPIVTEVMNPREIDLVAKYADIIQVGARNMQNFSLLKELGKINKPILLKRGMMNTIKEFLMSAEYVLSEGNQQVILCERGIRTFETATRNTLDISCIPVLKKETHLPIIIDPSHATGHWEMVESMSRASIAAGADGLIIEVHPDPVNAFSDGPQSLKPEKFSRLMENLRPFAELMGRTL